MIDRINGTPANLDIYKEIKEIVIERFGKAYDSKEFVKKIRDVLSKYGIVLNGAQQNAILGIIKCRDEIVNVPEGLMNLNYMDLSSFGALYFGGADGFRVLAHHVPEVKDKWIVVMQLVHTGYNIDDHEFGYIRRYGQEKRSKCCGAHHLLREAKKLNGDNLEPYTEIHNIYHLVAKKVELSLDNYEWSISKLYKQNAIQILEWLYEVMKEEDLKGFVYLPFLQIHVQNKDMQPGEYYDMFVPLHNRIIYRLGR